MLKKLSLISLIFLFLCSPSFSSTIKKQAPPKTSLQYIEVIGKNINEKITNFLKNESKEGRFNRKCSIEYQSELLKKINTEFIQTEKTINILNSRLESWGQPGDLQYINVKIFVDCKDCPDNLFIMDFYYMVYEPKSQDPVLPEKSVKI
jgi:hypothetical protein